MDEGEAGGGGGSNKNENIKDKDGGREKGELRRRAQPHGGGQSEEVYRQMDTLDVRLSKPRLAMRGRRSDPAKKKAGIPLPPEASSACFFDLQYVIVIITHVVKNRPSGGFNLNHGDTPVDCD